MSSRLFSRQNLPRLLLMFVTAVAITWTGIVFHQPVYRIIPLYVSLFVAIFQAQANRYASLLGGLNSILYAVVYYFLGLYASAGYALLFSCPIQLLTFIRWSKRKYEQSTTFRRLGTAARIGILAGFAVGYFVLFRTLQALGSGYSYLDTLTTLLGILISFLTLFACVEYTYLMIPSGIVGICLNLKTMAAYPDQITYLIFSIYSLICITIQFFRVRALYARQHAAPENGKEETQ